MNLEGAKIRNIFKVCTSISGEDESPLKINIPYYQRPYKWGEEDSKEKIELLIADFYENCKLSDKDSKGTKKKEYFAGSIVTVKDQNEESYQDLIDGQQRITTVFLINYIKYLLFRAYIANLIEIREGMDLKTAFDDLANAAKLLYDNGYEEIINIKNEVTEKYKSYKKIDDLNDKNNKFKELLNFYKNKVFLPQEPFDAPDYKDKHRIYLERFLKKRKLSLQYNRNSFYERLMKAMSYIRIKLTSEEGPIFEVNIDNSIEEIDSIVENYLNALKTIYTQFEYFIFEKNKAKYCSFEKINKFKIKIDEFLENIIFCVIQTTDTNDAYTLFEVLNDRALELDDLDLIKNMFYKEYCQKNIDKDDSDLDTQIEKLEELWGEKIFSHNNADWKNKFIAFLGAIFLTGDNSIRYSTNQKYRENIKGFLKEEYTSQYKTEDIIFNFNIFYAANKYLNVFDIKYQNKKGKSLKAIFSDFSVTYITAHILRALKLNGVIAALFNVILKKYLIINNNELDIDKFELYLKRIKNDKNHNKTEYIDVHKCAFNLRKISLLAENYKEPREFAKDIIGHNFYKDYNNTYIQINQDIFDRLKEEFREWTGRWYKGKKGDFKIKILFLELIKTDKENNKLCYKDAHPILDNPEDIQLDHFEPNKIKDFAKKYYFQPDPIAGEKNRDDYVNQLGNFMILDKKENPSLSNKPAEETLQSYKNMGFKQVWLIEEINEMLNRYSENSDGKRIPKEEFFTIRKEKLQKYFYTLLCFKIDQKELEVKEIN